MKLTKLPLKNLLKDESGQDLIEYALIAGVVGLGAVASLNALASNIGTSFTGVGTTLQADI